MLIAILNCCTKEELEEEEETPMAITPEAEQEETTREQPLCRIRTILMKADEGTSERRQVIKNKILAVGRMSRVFALLR